MLSLDPTKFLIIGVVALVVLGPDKLPSAARKASALLADLRAMRASLQQSVHDAVGDVPLTGEFNEAKAAFSRIRASGGPGQAIHRSITNTLAASPRAVEGLDDGPAPAGTPMPVGVNRTHPDFHPGDN